MNELFITLNSQLEAFTVVNSFSSFYHQKLLKKVSKNFQFINVFQVLEGTHKTTL